MADSTKFHPHNNPTKFYSHFLYKALLVTIFCVILPIFPSQPPEFINQTLNTRGWEFLHLVFVGIAVSYGLFSRRNDDSEKDNIANSHHSSSKFDNAQSYVSRFLQVPSVFDDEGDAPQRSDGISTVQTWNNQYHRNEPVAVVADHEQQRSNCSRVGEKPLLLPVRSLKSRVFEAESDEIRGESSGVSANPISDLKSKRVSADLEENNVVLPSPIPWRSRSGRIEFKETKQEPNSPLYSQPSSSMEKSESNKSFKAQSTPLSRSDSTISSPKKLSTETRGKSAEDFVRKKNIFRSPPPPPPPPPPPTPPHLIRKLKTTKPIIHDEVFTPQMPKSVRTSRSNETYPGGKEFDQSLKANRDRVSFMPQPTFMEFPREEKEETVEKLVLETETEDDEEEEDDEIEATDSFVSVPCSGEQSSCGGAGSDAAGPDVDKKADEFIAKFREQIRLQRIESIKRSTGQINIKIASLIENLSVKKQSIVKERNMYNLCWKNHTNFSYAPRPSYFDNSGQFPPQRPMNRDNSSNSLEDAMKLLIPNNLKFQQAIDTRFQILETEVSQIATSLSKLECQGRLPYQFEVNSREIVNYVTLESGKVLQDAPREPERGHNVSNELEPAIEKSEQKRDSIQKKKAYIFVEFEKLHEFDKHKSYREKKFIL